MTPISTYQWPGETHLGPGAAKLVGEKTRAFGSRKAFVLADPGIIAAGLLAPIQISLEQAGVEYVLYDQVVPNPDIGSVDAGALAFRESEADIIVGFGGGSALDTAKAIRLLAGGPAEASIAEYGLVLGDDARPAPLLCSMPTMIAIPTTAGTGSEVTPWAVITNLAKEAKFAVGGAYLLPTIALIDPELTFTLPTGITAATGIDALSHLIEAYVSTNPNPALDPLILRGISLVGRNLRLAVAQGGHLQARQAMLEASMLGGIGISSNWLGACHSLAHQLSSFAHLHHGVAIALMLPHQMQYSLPAALDRYADIGQALEPHHPPAPTLHQRAEQAVASVRRLIADVDLPTRLQDAGVDENLIPAMAKSAYANDSNWMNNPRAIDQEMMEALYRQAF